MLVYLFTCIVFSRQALGYNFSTINLPEEHLPYYFATYQEVAKNCEEDPTCLYKKFLHKDKCWGYEGNCTWDKQYSNSQCPGDHRGWVKTKFDQQNTFYTQADFGYVKQQIQEMKVLCEPLFAHDSSLECSEHLRFCRGRNIMVNFTALRNRDEPLRYKMDVLKEGEIGGYCKFYKEKLDHEADHISALQSWGPELRYFTQLHTRPIESGNCDIVIEKPTYIMKIDATVNMYHHFCDFFNLYASLHINSSHWQAFSTDVHILIWETFNYYSDFGSTWEAFTEHSIWDLKTFRGEVVCFKNVVFPLLPRMIFGLYYNTPVIYGCEKSGLFDAFAKHVIHRLQIPFHKRESRKIRVTLLSRETKYRRILNEFELIKALQENDELVIERVVYSRNISFKKQLEITHNSDVFIGMHGAGLTHLLFLPEWAAVFELYNCEDENCYKDLARIRGVKYVTWEDTSKLYQDNSDSQTGGGAHAKFRNYSFDVNEFLRLVQKAVTHVKNHQKFRQMLEGVKQSERNKLKDGLIDHDEL